MPDWTSVLFTGSPAVASLLTSSPNAVQVANKAGHVVAQTSLTAIKTVSIGKSDCLASVVTSVCCLSSLSPRCSSLSCRYMHTCARARALSLSLSLTHTHTHIFLCFCITLSPLPQAHATPPTAAAPRATTTTMESAISRSRVSASARAGGTRASNIRRGSPGGASMSRVI